MANWVPVAGVADCPPGASRECVVAGRIIAVYNVEGQFLALDGVCPHQGGPLGKGRVTGCVVTCPWHGWQFDVRTGKHQFSPNVTQPRYEVRVVGDELQIDLD